MKKFRGILLITILVPTLAFASFGDSFNKLLNRFFGNGANQETTEPAKISRDLPVPDDLTGFRREIQKEEDALNEIENRIFETQERLQKVASEKNTVEYQLQFLDQDISLAQQKLAELRRQKEKWKKKLEQITREKSNVEAEERVLKRDLQNHLSKNFIHDESLGSGSDVSIFRWLFSRKTVSQILEERMQKRLYEQRQKQIIYQLENSRKKLANEEYDTAKVYHRVEKLTQQEADQQRLLKELADAKARILTEKRLTKEELESEIAEARQRQAESTIVLQNLRLGMKEFQDYNQDDSNNSADKQPPSENAENPAKLAFPLKIPRKITATFHDPDYKRVMGREHLGVDFRAPQSTEILAPADGVVKKVATNGYKYSYLIIDHGNDLYTLYGHISRALVKEGDQVKKGDKIALTGGTPGMLGSGYFTTGPHLHFEVFKNGHHVNPLDYLK